ncbi:MAG: ADP-ribosylglycohydrolase family protein, partial [Erysipelotrichales bacterium]
MERSQRIAGCLIGGAIGDALGWPVEFLSMSAIRKAYGEDGIDDLVKNKENLAEFTDDTQMTLFTVDGVLRYLGAKKKTQKEADFTKIMHASYRRWLFTQQAPRDEDMRLLNGWLYPHRELHVRRAPGNSCLSALSEPWIGTIGDPINTSKGCGAVMRAAPIGLVFDAEEAFTKGMIAGALTHGHPSGYLGSAALARIIAELLRGESLSYALGTTMERLKSETGHEECVLYLKKAYELALAEIEPTRSIEALGLGWVAEEALAIAVYCALKFENDGQRALRYAVNHDGDSDSTGAI